MRTKVLDSSVLRCWSCALTASRKQGSLEKSEGSTDLNSKAHRRRLSCAMAGRARRLASLLQGHCHVLAVVPRRPRSVGWGELSILNFLIRWTE